MINHTLPWHKDAHPTPLGKSLLSNEDISW